MGVTVPAFAEEAHQMHFLQFLREDWGEYGKMACTWKGEESIKKICFYRI